jgi:glycosyltransferase involved in cell wall biosynthesis
LHFRIFVKIRFRGFEQTNYFLTIYYLLTAIICGAYTLLMLRYLYGWSKIIPSISAKANGGEVTFCTIVIPVRNEEQNIFHCLASINAQTHTSNNFEIIVVDDHSTDKTAELIESQKNKYLKLIRLSNGQNGKKAAIAEGVKNANGKLIITTDADCEMGKNWLSAIVSFYEEKKCKMIVAPVVLKNESSFQQNMQSQEMTVLTASSGASLNWNQPILCSGANLIYEREAFYTVGGFEGIDKTATGDDIFLMLKFQKEFPGEIKYLKSKDAVVFTDPARSSSQALGQRKRWASKGLSYGFNHITLIAILVFFTNFLILISGILSVINIKFVLVLIICFSAKFLVDLMLLYAASSFFEKKISPFAFVLASLIYPVYVSLIGLISPFTNYSWKSRIS